MKHLTFIALGLLVAAGCAESGEYEVNKPVLTEPVPHTPALTPEADSDLDVDINDNDAIDDATDTNTATPNSAAPGAAGASPATSGAIEDDTLDDKDETASP